MMDYFGAIVLVIIFVFLLKLAKLVENSIEVVSISRMAMSDIRNPELSDDIKEVRIQKHALLMVKYFFILTISTIFCLAMSTGLICLLDYFSVLSFENVITITFSVWFLALSSILVSMFLWYVAKNSKDTPS